jgi:hypothetical protein
MELAFIIFCCGSIFLTPFLISGKCGRLEYIIKIIIVTILETLIILFLFTGIFYQNSHKFYYGSWDIVYFLYIFIFIYNNIITVKRCNYIGLKKYNFIMPMLHFLKLLFLIGSMIVFVEGPNLWKIFISIIILTNIIQIASLFNNEDKEDGESKT